MIVDNYLYISNKICLEFLNENDKNDYIDAERQDRTCYRKFMDLSSFKTREERIQSLNELWESRCEFARSVGFVPSKDNQNVWVKDHEQRKQNRECQETV